MEGYMRRMSALVSLLALGAALLPAAVDPKLLALVPPDAKTLAGIHVEHGLATPFGQFLMSQIPNNPVVQQFAAASGFDFKKDLIEVLVSSQDAAAGMTAAAHNLVALRGTFDIPKLVMLNNLTGGSATIKEGIQWMTINQGPAAQTVAFLDSSILLVGPPDMIDAAIAQRTASPDRNSPLIQRALTASSTNEIWFVSATPIVEILQKAPTPVPLAAFDSIMGYSAGLHLDDVGVTLSAEVATRTAQDAQGLAAILKLAAGMAKGPQALPLDQAQVETDGPTLKFKLSVPEAQVERLMKPAQPAQRISLPPK
jgi:hypothetical protein